MNSVAIIEGIGYKPVQIFNYVNSNRSHKLSRIRDEMERLCPKNKCKVASEVVNDFPELQSCRTQFVRQDHGEDSKPLYS